MSENSIRKLTREWLLRRWTDLARDLSLVGDVEAVGRDLLERYAEPHRRYHDIEHVRECLELLDIVAHMAGDLLAVEAAVWFHDAIYKGGAGDNVKRSADLARGTLMSLGAPAGLAEKVRALVMVTEHSALTAQPLALTSGEDSVSREGDLGGPVEAPVYRAAFTTASATRHRLLTVIEVLPPGVAGAGVEVLDAERPLVEVRQGDVTVRVGTDATGDRLWGCSLEGELAFAIRENGKLTQSGALAGETLRRGIESGEKGASVP